MTKMRNPEEEQRDQTKMKLQTNDAEKAKNYQSMDELKLNSSKKSLAKDGSSTKMPYAQRSKTAETWSEIINLWPKTILLIVSNEFCERFSYYGMRTILTLYLLNVLKFSSDASTMFFNGFSVICYSSPLLGSILADGYIGKFMTILILSIFYSIGQIMLASGSIAHSGSPLHPYLDLVGLLVIAIGTGGIKPCVSSFGGDQFEPHQEKMISIFFSVFYFSINAGATISTFLSPIFRATPCLGQDSCYPLAFGIPALLMIIATLIFISGSYWYQKMPPKVNVFGEVYAVSKRAFSNRWRDSQGRGGHFLDFYFDSHNCARDSHCLELQQRRNNPFICQKKLFVNDIKGLFRIMVILSPVPIFWSLYDQQGSRWMLQAIQMDCRIWNNIMLLPDQMQTLNAILILAFIPIFQIVIYPLFSLCFKITPLRKMVAGGFLAALAFVVSAAVQFRINETLPDLPGPGRSFVSVINAFDECMLEMSVKGMPSIQPITLSPNQTLMNEKTMKELLDLPGNSQTAFNFQYNGAKCHSAGVKLPTEVEYNIELGTFYLMATPQGTVFSKASTKKPVEGAGEFSLGITLALNDFEYQGNLALCRIHSESVNSKNPSNNSTVKHPCNPAESENFYTYQIESGDLVDFQPFALQNGQNSSKHSSIYRYKSIRPGRWALYFMENTMKTKGLRTISPDELRVEPVGVELEVEGQGGVYMVAVTGDKIHPQKRVFQVVQDNQLSILWQIPQITILTAAEVLFSITGLEFAYSQSASSMKSLVQALWLLTTAIGNALIVVITYFHFQNMAYEFLFYSSLMMVVTIILALLAIFYYQYSYNESRAGTESSAGESNWDSMTSLNHSPGGSAKENGATKDAESQMR